MKVHIVVRFSDAGAGAGQQPDLCIPLLISLGRDDVNKLVNSLWLKLMIRSKVDATSRRRLRLIYNGRILNDETDFQAEVFGPKLRQLRQTPQPAEPQEPLQIYVHCLVGEHMTREQLAREKDLDRRAQTHTSDAPVVGFDRLLLQGMDALDVADLRRQFQQIYLPANTPNHTGVADVEEDEDRQRLVRELEERWLESTMDSTNGRPARPHSGTYDPEAGDAQPNLAERAAAELEGTHHNEHLLLGLLLGTFLGAVALVFLLMDDTLFNDAQKMAMVLGVCINLFIAFMRVGSEYGA
ncbi:hypothetical protein METBIDRAFT_78480 [Metschnikowia bicuspidata var. bicuspidata NRRL YB-4993]|uniref:Ubiquitin-like domain-containing protein n=1 Tax=Metschnikowia bicuspidata var. bicuspidata NRRL YB-4993 TaxID=869754 RepID=A0A1A0HCB7_9ASCO|nr:hypothetical protein METBIDRAFT_78480 [Metschnikowia bicuspidata var. bicuspidata NRRL YB-4993]OBA21548.1 hypothetical protein METBIDRAFT_78480 [Metschnikowia bicuspidata var. bicuspidata NRRL YB-4993]